VDFCHKEVGRTPWSARVPPDPLFGVATQQADVGVGCGAGGPPKLSEIPGAKVVILRACDYPTEVAAELIFLDQ
jgi:hypothetical protein